MAKWFTVRRFEEWWFIDTHIGNTYTARGQHPYRSKWSAMRAAKGLSTETGWGWGCSEN